MIDNKSDAVGWKKRPLLQSIYAFSHAIIYCPNTIETLCTAFNKQHYTHKGRCVWSFLLQIHTVYCLVNVLSYGHIHRPFRFNTRFVCCSQHVNYGNG
jgi:hypothetical protein